MEEWVNLSKKRFDEYYNSFTGLSQEQENNFTIKKEHSHRVAEICYSLAEKLKLGDEDKYLAFYIGLFHDIGRFKQLLEFNTFNDSKSVDHAEYSVAVLKEGNFGAMLNDEQFQLALFSIQNHNKLNIPKGLSGDKLLFSQLIRDADKLDILKVLTDYYSNAKARPNHTLTWEMPKGVAVSPEVKKQILSGKLVSKEKVQNELDIKVMQLSWVYDINFKPSFEFIVQKRFLENIYNSLPKNDGVIEIYRKVKVYTENKFIG
jgi:putative nucleotidyltransferase with HDIG domain